MTNIPSGRGQVVTAQFSRGEPRRPQNCTDCYCECHDDAPMPPGTYVTIHLAEDQAVGVGGHVHIQPEPEQGSQAQPDALPERPGAVIRVTEFNGVQLPWTVYASLNGRSRWTTLDGTEWPGVGQEAADAEITGWHPINLVPSGGTSQLDPERDALTSQHGPAQSSTSTPRVEAPPTCCKRRQNCEHQK